MQNLCGDHLLAELSLEPNGKLHRRLFRVLQRAITQGIFPPQTRLPASRDLANQLNISRNTVLTAYDALLAEGYVIARTGSGTWVANTLPDFCLANQSQSLAKDSNEEGSTGPVSNRGNELLNQATASPYQWGAFVPGAPDVTAFPHKIFHQIQTRLQKQPAINQLIYSNEGGCPHLRQAVANYLRISRSVRAKTSQIIITEGIHQAVDLVSRLLADQGDLTWIEDPGYWGTRNILQMNGLIVQPLPIDEQGIIPEPRCIPSPRLVFVTPSHQYPTGVHLSMERRRQLLTLARQHRFWIIEDDYDSEFRFNGLPHPSLQGLEENSPVLYMGTFSKTLYPALRIGYLVVPESLSEPLRVAAAELYRGGHLIKQRAVAEFINQGHYAAHIRRMRLLYNQRRLFLLNLIERYLGANFLPRYPHDAGLHLVLSLPEHCNDVQLTSQLLVRGVKVRPLSKYYLRPSIQRGLLLGYACVSEVEIFQAFNQLRECLVQAGLLKSPGGAS